MEYTARWGPKAFLISAQKIVPLTGLQTSVSVKSETQNDTSGTSQTNVTGRELQPVSLSTVYMRAAGVDPRAQLEEWEALVGQINTLIIGGKRFGPAKLMLKNVAVSEVLTDNFGNFLSVNVALSFEEYANGSQTSATTSTGTGSSSTASVYADTVAKKKALKASATPVDRAEKKPTRTTERAMLQ